MSGNCKSGVHERKSWVKCAVCKDRNYSHPERKFFRFPKDVERSRLWTEACQKNGVQLESLSPNALHRKVRVCSKHFNEGAFATSKKHFLNSCAVPSIFVNSGNATAVDVSCIRTNLSIQLEKTSGIVGGLLKLEEQSGGVSCDQTGSFSSFLSISSSTQSSVAINSPNYSSLTCTLSESPPPSLSFSVPSSTPISKLLKVPGLSTPRRNVSLTRRVITPKTLKIKRLSSKLYYLKKKQASNSKSSLKLALAVIKDIVTPVLYNFIESQLKASLLSKYGRRWTLNDKNICLQFYLASPKAYNTLKKFLHLPSKPTLLKCLQQIHSEPGFSTSVLNAMQLVASKLKKHDKYCILSFDEISLKPSLQYDKKKDIINGFENYGSYSSSYPNIATHALVFMVRGLCKKWKQAIGYFFSSHTAPAAMLKVLVSDAIIKLIQCGLQPVAIVCDQGANNQRLYAKELCVKPAKPYFYLDDHKVFTLFDVPHLLKSLRNNLSKYPVKFYNNKIAFFDHIITLWEFDRKLPHRIVPKLTEKHIKVDGLSAMSVKLATQLLSKSVAAGLSCLSALGQLPISATDTADFCSAVNDLFDSLNSRVLLHKTLPLLSGVTTTSPHINFWQSQLKFVRSIEFQTQGKKITFPCLLGWEITLSAVLELVPTLFIDVPTVLMCRFNQDALENFFSGVRRRGGNDDHPSAHIFHQSIKMSMAQNIINTCGMTNCEPDSDTVLVPTQVLTELDTSEQIIMNDNNFDIDVDDPACMENETITDPIRINSAAYVAGFVAKRTCAMFNCTECHRLLLGDKTLTENSLFLYFKEFDDVKRGLSYPSSGLLMSICKMGELFVSMFSLICHEKNIKKKLISQLTKVEHEWLTCNIHESEIWDYMVSYYVQLMIYYKIKEMSKEIKSRRKAKKKLTKLN